MGPLIQQVCLVTCLIFFPCSSAPVTDGTETERQSTIESTSTLYGLNCTVWFAGCVTFGIIIILGVVFLVWYKCCRDTQNPPQPDTASQPDEQADQLLQTVNQPTDIDVKHLNEVDVTLDVDTAHPNLLIDGKTVSWIKETPQRLCSEKMFDEDPYVLGIMGRAWRAYWKVNVEKKEDWVLGVTKATSNRKGQLVLSPANGFWVIRLSNGGTLKAMDDKEHVLDKDIPDKIGIYLDYKEKKVTFYNVEDSSLIYSFTNGPSYQDDVRPLFSPWNNDADPITILSIV
ncbi:zinc-binding protein A33-like [Oncorhynchus nerka]|uniref:zinc-binding protein A33-like n=1 Tax=Oncorhynchus nerka TaxID=8023 RepID=UPI001130D89C|nr:zinc-binding protein A33-like isoform X1 [Oncorhynchus nerka]XP_029508156.1 zinc-binding protein A33-like isoform X1 [Oncorhynchus nerka]